MSYKSILVNLDIEGPVVPLLNLAVKVAARFEARLIGFSAADARLPYVGPEGGAIAAEVWEQEREGIERRLNELHAEFDRLAARAIDVEWRQMTGDPTRSLANTARLADVIITTARDGASTGDAYRAVDPGSLALQAGRPVLVAADGAAHLPAKNVVIAWKDTREARRAVASAVPLLLSADEVTVVTVDCDGGEEIRASIADVAAFLLRHGIKARTEVITAKDEIVSLGEFITTCHADLVVSGAYGHSRLREWAFGGVTRSLLDEMGLNRFMAS